VIETLARFRHPFTIITKSALILRDLDILAPMAGGAGAGGGVDHQLDRKLARSMEPRAATPKQADRGGAPAVAAACRPR
jgi:DNA repair photolyase